MPTPTQFIEHSQLFPLQQTLIDNPDILNTLINYISLNPDILLQNQQQCYAYPNKSSQILSTGSAFRALIQKKERINDVSGQKQNSYPFLEKLFKNIIQNREQMKERANEEDAVQQLQIQQCLLGYINRVLISLAKKTPQIYEYFKDNQQVMTKLVKDNQFLKALQQFWNIFMVQSTMNLYVFLKNLFLRALMFRIIDEKDTDNLVVYECLANLYEQIIKKMQSPFLPQDQKQQLEELCGNYHDEDFITLMILKISCCKSDKTYCVGKLFNSIIKNPLNENKVKQNSPKKQRQNKQQKSQQVLQVNSTTSQKHNSQKYALSLSFISQNYIEVIEQYFESYEDSSNFMDYIMPDQIQLLKFMISLSQKQLLACETQANLLKRLLVYSSIHKNNSIIHCMLLKLIKIIYDKNHRQKVFAEINVIPFLLKNSKNQQNTNRYRYSFNSQVYQICKLWLQKEDLMMALDEQQQKFVKDVVNAKQQKLINLEMYKPKTRDISQQVSPFQTNDYSPQKKQSEQMPTDTPTKPIQS